jgi:hypothetical protein
VGTLIMENLRRLNLKQKLKTNANELALPGTLITDEILSSALTGAAKGENLSLKEARKKTFSKISEWRKNK